MSLRHARKILPVLLACAAPSLALGPVAVVSDDGRVYTATSDASGGFGGWSQVVDFGAGNLRGVALEHFDRDGYIDLVAGRVSGNEIILYKFPGQAGGGFGSRQRMGSFNGPGSYLMDVAAGDFNGDGVADIVANTNSTTTGFFMSTPAGGWQIRTEALDTQIGRGMDAGDVNEDGRLDLVRARYSDGQVALYLGDGDGTFTFSRLIGDAGTDPYGLAVADFNTDGHLDVIANEGGSGNPILWRGAGNGTFLPSMVPAGADLNNYAAWDAFDFNGDGNADLVACNYTSQSVQLLPGLGNGNFGAMVRINPMSPSPGNLLGAAAPPYRHPLAPIATAIPAEQTLAAGGSAHLDGSASTAAPGTSIASQAWIFGDGAEADGAVADHTYAAKGRYWPRHVVRSNAGLADMAKALAIVTGPPPVANAGGPYAFTEAQALNEIWTGQLDGRATLDDGGEGATYAWNLMPDITFSDEFTAPLDGSAWIHAGSSVSDGYLHLGSTSLGDWGASRLTSQQTFARRQGLTFYTRLRTRASENFMFGIKNNSATNHHYNQLQHAFYIAQTGLYIYENGSSRGHFRTIAYGQWYDLKIELLASGAAYWYRPASSEPWELVYTSTHNSGAQVKVGLSGYFQGQNDIEYLYFGRRAEGALVTETFSGPATHPITLTVTDFLGQSSTASTTVTTSGNALPEARTGGPYLFGENAALNGQYVARLDGRTSSDDFGVAQYLWDFGDGTTGTGAQPVKTYAGRGPYTLRLTVRDHAGQTHGDESVVSFSAGAPPVARIVGPASINESSASAGNWTTVFQGGTSTDDVGIWRYEWNFGNGRTATGASPTATYTAMGTYTVTLTVFDHAGQSHSTTHSIQVQGNDLPVARIAAPSQLDEAAAQHGLYTAAFSAAGSTDDFGIWRYQWAFGDGGTATVASPTHQFAGPGSYTVRLTVTDHAGQSTFVDHPLTLVANDPPVARITATPTTVEGAREVSFSGLPSSDDFGISDWAWDFGERMFPFDGTVLSTLEWQPSAGVIQDDRVILTGNNSFGARFVQSTRAYQRESELRARVRVPAGTHQGVIGFKAVNETAAQADFAHAVHFNNGRWHIIENGSTSIASPSYPNNAEYEIRIVTKAAGADFYIRPIATPAWTLLRSTAAVTTYPLEVSWSIISGTFEFDDVGVRARAHGPQAVAAFGATGQATLTVTDHARQTHGATQAITVVQGAAPTAVIQSQDSYGAGLEMNFSGLGSVDDHAVARYEWDFGDGSSAVGDRAVHSYALPGVYTVRLTVQDYAGQTGTAAKPVNITGQNMVRCVPWRFNNGIEVPHEAWTGKVITLKGVASTAPRPFTYEWDFGDGSPLATGTVTTEEQAYEIQAQHAYTGSHGTPFVATLGIVDAAGNRSTDTYPIIMKDRTLTVETNVAIDEALWYLHKSQIRSVSGGIPLGHWVSYSSYRTNASASAIQAFEINGHQPQGDPAQDPYVETVRRGLDNLLTMVSYNNIGPQTYGNPDANGNGIGLGGTESDQPYQMGAVMDAIISSGAPTLLSRTGGTNVRGRRYIDLVQDMADMYAWGQDETGQGRGGWRYSWHGGSDNSAAQWGAIGLIPAERIWGITVPAFVKSENQVWLNASYQGGTPAQCGFGYTGPGHSFEQTSSGMVQLAFLRAPRNQAQWACTEARMDNSWASFLTANTTYGYYAFTKAMRLAVPPVVNLSVSGRDWFDADPNGLRRTLVTRQRADGSWLSNHSLPSEPIINTAWTTIILTPTLFENPPVAIIHASPNPGAVGQAVRFDGSQSYHVDPFREVVTYAWDFDASDGVDWETPDAEGPIANHAFGALRSYTVSLRVGDDQDPRNFDVATARIDITIPPHPPTSVPGGPYVAATGETVALDGSGSFDIDAGQGDLITRYGWETDFLNPRDFDDALGARPTGVTFPSAGTFNVGLRVTDNTAAAFPQSGSPDLTHDAFTTVQVHNRCLENLAARGKATMVALTWTHDGSSRYTVRRSTVSPSFGFEEIGSTANTYSTFIDYNVETGRTYYYRVESANNCASHAVSIVPRFRSTNRRPVFTSTPPTAAQEAQAFAYDADAGDPEGQALTWFLDEAPAGMSINAATGLVAWTPTQAQVGSHTVSIRAVDPGDMAVVQAFILTVAPRPNLPPTVAVTGPAAGLSGQALFFDGAGSSDPENDAPLSYAWNFGDGNTATGPSASHVFGAAGTYVVTLFVTDSRGATGAGTHTVTVNEPNRIPIARPGGPYIVPAGDPLTFDGSASSDPDGEPLTFTWNFGDNTGAFDGAVVAHAYAAEGTYLASLEVNDGRGGVGGATVPVLVTSANNAPVARIAASAAFVNPGDEITFDAAGSTDADGDAMVFTWAFGDGSQTGGDVVTHVYNAPGHYTVSLTADDQRGRQGSATEAIHVNAPPVFQDPGPLSTAEDAPFVLGLSAPDADGHAVSFSLVSGPAGLTVQNGPGSVFWQPGNGDVGSHSVRLRATDGLGGVDETVFTLTVINVNDPPEIASAPVLQAVELSQYLYGATVLDIDAGDAVTFSLPEAPAGMTVNPVSGLVSWTPTHAQVGNHNVTLVAADAAGSMDVQEFRVTVAELPWAPEFTSAPPAASTEDQPFQYQATATDLNAADVLSFALLEGPSGMGIDPASGLVTWTPLNEHVGPRPVRLRVSDGSLSAEQVFTLTVANTNDAPSIASTAPGVGVVGETLLYDVQGTDPDAGDVLTYTLTQGSGDAALNPSTGLLTWTPVEAELGERAFRVIVQDAAGQFAAQDFTVRVQRTPEPPVFTSAAPTAATQGQAYTYQATATDPNDDLLTFALVSGPTGMTVSPAGLVAFTPGPAQTGNQAVSLSVTDSRFTVEQAFTLVVANVNDEPVISSQPPLTGTDGVTYAYQVAASDADGDPLAYSLTEAPAGMTVSATGLISWPDDGSRPLQADVELTVTDGQGGDAVQAWTVEMVADNVGPSVSISLSANPAAPGQFVTVTVNAADNVGVQSRALSVDGAPVTLSGGQYQYLAGGPGEVRFTATAVDLNGNSGQGEALLQVSATADAVAPAVTLTYGPANPRVGDLVTFQVGVSDGGGVDPERTWLLVDGIYLPIVNGRAEFTVPKQGPFSAHATAYDLSGNFGQALVNFSASIAGSDAVAPTALITSPADHVEVLGRMDIVGTATDANFAYYTLSLRDEGTATWTEFHRSATPVTAGTLGTFDATQIENGEYQVRLQAFDRFGNQASDVVLIEASGEAKVGEFTLSFLDMQLKLTGLDLEILRNYDSRVKTKRDFGIGWSLEVRNSVKVVEKQDPNIGWKFECTMELFGTCLQWKTAEGYEHHVTVDIPGFPKQEFLLDAVSEYAQPNGLAYGTVQARARPGTFTRLEPIGGHNFDFVMGGELLDGDFLPVDPDLYRLTMVDGTTYIIDQANGRVTQIGDANGNQVTIAANGIAHSDGRQFNIFRDAQDRITRIADGDAEILYAYDGHGNLASVRDVSGNLTRFKYDQGHRLTEVIDPRGVRAVRTEYDADGRLVRRINPDGKEMTYDHDLDGAAEEITDFEGNTTRYEYDPKGNVTSKRDPRGNEWTYSYDEKGNLLETVNPDGTRSSNTWNARGDKLTSTDELGRTTTWTYNALGRPLTERDPLGRVTTRTWDARGNDLTETGPDGVVQRTFTYDGNGRALTERDALGRITTFAYVQGRVTATTDPLGRVHRTTYDARGYAATMTDARGNVTSMVNDKAGNPLTVTDALGGVTAYAYTSFNRPASKRDARGNLTRFEYDASGQLRRDLNPDGGAIAREYDGNGRVNRTIDPTGRSTRMVFDDEGRLLETEFADGTRKVNEYDARGHLAATVDERGERTTYVHDAAGQLLSARDPLGNVTAYEYDLAGNQVAATDPLGRRTQFVYDDYDRLIRTVHPGGAESSVEYDDLGQKVAETDEMGRTTRWAYDEVGNLIRVTDAAGGITEYAYDADNNRVSVRDANGSVTAMEYDALNRMTAKVFPGGARETYAYEAEGLLTRKTLATGEATDYQYDAMKRETLRSYSGSGRTLATEYSLDGLRTAVVDHRGRTAYGYDARGRLISVTQPDGAYLLHAYDAAGHKIESHAGHGDTEWTRTSYTFDGAGRMSRVDQGPRVTAYGYDAAGNRTLTRHSNGVESHYAYDNRNRLLEVSHRNGAAVLGSYAYTLDASGLRTGVLDGDGANTQYGYDVLRRLTSETRTGVSAYAQTYTYDPVGNRLSKAEPAGTTTYAYDARNQLTGESGPAGTIARAYDAAGRLLSATGAGSFRTFAWADQDRLVSASVDGEASAYLYDGDGRKVADSGSAGRVRYLIDETLPYDQVVAEYDDGGNLLAAYAFGQERISQVRGADLRVYLPDGQGSTRLLADAGGAVTDTYAFKAFGEVLARTGTTDNGFLYTGEQQDGVTGQVYLRARWMDPNVGRFTSPDPFEGCPSCPVSLHPYQYADLSPVSMSDPTGMFTLGSISISISIQSNLQNTNRVITVKRGQQIIKLLTCGAGTAYFVRAVKGLHGHHAFMKSMGGRANQPLIYLPPEAHHAFHWILDLVLKEKGLGHGSMTKAQWNAALNNPATKKAVKQLYLKVARLIDKACKFKGPLSLVAFTKKEMKAIGF